MGNLVGAQVLAPGQQQGPFQVGLGGRIVGVNVVQNPQKGDFFAAWGLWGNASVTGASLVGSDEDVYIPLGIEGVGFGTPKDQVITLIGGREYVMVMGKSTTLKASVSAIIDPDQPGILQRLFDRLNGIIDDVKKEIEDLKAQIAANA